jgi:hypothetical protein
MHFEDKFLPMNSENIIKLHTFSLAVDEYTPKLKQTYLYQALQVKVHDFMDENNIGYLWDGMIYKDKESNLYFMDSKT